MQKVPLKANIATKLELNGKASLEKRSGLFNIKFFKRNASGVLSNQ
jgi:hypothetical protein